MQAGMVKVPENDSEFNHAKIALLQPRLHGLYTLFLVVNAASTSAAPPVSEQAPVR
jgi:hypothetical protein